jgi:lipopolysaccharide transport system ATP-binding protein
VKRYSSGMYVRMAFAVAAHLEPEILLVDEVLSVGDAAFQRKCLGKMGDVAKIGRTILFVSHNLAAIENLCKQCVMLDSGKLVKQGDTQQIVHFYLQQALNLINDEIYLPELTNRTGTGHVKLVSFHIEDSHRNRLTSIQSGADVVFTFGYVTEKNSKVSNVDIGFSIHSMINDQILAVLYSSYVSGELSQIPSSGFFRCHVKHLPFSPGLYRIGARVVANGIESDWPKDGVGSVNIVPGNFYGSGRMGFEGNVPFLLMGEWKVEALS